MSRHRATFLSSLNINFNMSTMSKPLSNHPKRNHLTTIRLALSRVAVQYRKNKYHQENVRKSLETVQDYILNTPKSRQLRLDLGTNNENECDLAVLHLRSPMLGSASDNNTGNDVVHSFQLSLPRFTFSGKDRKQHFFLDVVSTSSTEESKDEESDDEGETKNDASMHDTIVKKFTLKCDPEALFQEKYSPNKAHELTIDTSFDANLDQERFFKEANRFHHRLKPQKLDAGFQTYLDQLKREDAIANQILDAASCCSPASESKVQDAKGFGDECRSINFDRNDSSDTPHDTFLNEVEDINYDYLRGEESYPGQKERFEEMRLMELRRIEQEQEIQRLIIKAKRHTENEVKSICVYLQSQLKATQIALEEAERQRTKALEKAKLICRKQKKKRIPPWLRLYKESERRMGRAKQRSTNHARR